MILRRRLTLRFNFCNLVCRAKPLRQLVHKKFYAFKSLEEIQEQALTWGNEVMELFARLVTEQTDSLNNAGQLSLFAENISRPPI